MSELSDAAEEMENALNKMRDRMLNEGFSARAFYHINKNKTIDGEVRITDIPRKYQIKDIMALMNQSRTTISNQWASIRLIRPAREEEYITGQVWKGNRFVGQIDTNWFRTTKYKHPKLFITTRQIDSYSRQKRRRKVEIIVYRMYWNKENKKPVR